MRRALLVALTVPTLLLTACSNEGTVTESPSTDAASATEAAPTTEAAAATAATPDQAATSSDGEVEGGEDGAAAAAVAKKFFMAMVKSDKKSCDYLLSFSDPNRPIKDVQSDYEMCQEILPTVLEQEVAAQGLGEEGVAILEAMQIKGAQVDGDTAVIDQDNFSELFADSLDGQQITLKKIDGTWYIELDKSFQAPTGGR